MIRTWRLPLLSINALLLLSCCHGLLLCNRNKSRGIGKRAFSLDAKPAPETLQQRQAKDTIHFISPLLEYGYPLAVEEYENNTLSKKPLLLYLPGFDGTFLCPFLQFPEMGTVFDVRCMTIAASDRSPFHELKERVIQFIAQETTLVPERPIYLAGESFGGILACAVALQVSQKESLLKGLVLINPATCYDRSRLAQEGPAIAQLPWWKYPAGLLQLLPLFTDEFSFQQLLLILTAQALPSVTDSPMREAYMGRVAFSLPFVIPTVTPSTLQWRLHAWLEAGCQYMTTARLSTLREMHPTLRTLIVVGENDQTLPSQNEAVRLSKLLPNPCIQIVPGAGHASTCGSRADLAAYVRSHYPELQNDGRTEMKADAAQREGVWYGMQERYDSANIGLNPLLYWSPSHYRKYRPL